MNTTTEQLKRAMYGQFARTVKALQNAHNKNYKLSRLENSLESYLESLHQEAQESAANLASQAQTIEALHTVIKDQQTSLASLQGLLERIENERNSDQARAHRKIMVAEVLADNWREGYDLQFVQNQKRQKLIVSQRKTIEALTFELVSARKEAKRFSFFGFFKRESTKAKKLTK